QEGDVKRVVKAHGVCQLLWLPAECVCPSPTSRDAPGRITARALARPRDPRPTRPTASGARGGQRSTPTAAPGACAPSGHSLKRASARARSGFERDARDAPERATASGEQSLDVQAGDVLHRRAAEPRRVTAREKRL